VKLRTVGTRWLGLAILGASLLAMGACGEGEVITEPVPVVPSQTLPDRTPDLRGTITEVSSVSPLTILVEASPSEPVGLLGDKASIHIAADTAVFLCGGIGASVPDEAGLGNLGDLVEGRPILLWVDGPVAESYPVQAKAAAVFVGPSCG
jgi:hypothetical protein